MGLLEADERLPICNKRINDAVGRASLLLATVVTVRRLQDISHSGWWYWIVLVLPHRGGHPYRLSGERERSR